MRLALGVAALILVACSREPVPPPRPAAPAASVPGRIVSQTVLSDQVLWELGPAVRARVVGVSVLADDERYSPVAGLWPGVPRVSPASEPTLATRPDLVVVAEFTAAEAVALLEQAGVRTLTLRGFTGFDAYRGHVRELATVVGAPSDGERLIKEFDARLATIGVEAGALRPGILSWNEGSVPGSNTTFDEIARTAGYRNIPGEEGHTGHVRPGLEQITAWDPQYVVTTCGAAGCEQTERDLAGRHGFSATRAAREGNIIAIEPVYLYATGPGMLEVVDRLAARRREDH